MAPCRFFAQGNCRFADNCRYDHILPSGGGGNQGSSNRFAPLQNQNQSNLRSDSRNDSRGTSFHNNRQVSSRELPFSLDKDAIITDLTSERPQWILSSYGPGRHAPAQLFGGPQREQSFEEMRIAHYVAAAAGNPQQAAEEASQMYNAAEQQIQTALGNMDGAIEYLIKAQNEHPNRNDIVSQRNHETQPLAGASPFGNSSQGQISNTFAMSAVQPAQNAFGAPSQPSIFGAPSQPSAFGGPSQSIAFGQAPALGQKPSPFGAPSAPAFGAPSATGGGGSAFGQSTSLGQKPNPFGTPSGGGSFGAPSQPATSTPFAAQPTNAFGAPSQPVASNPFGAPSQPATAFGVPSQPAVNPNPFGQPSTTTTFGAASSTRANPFAVNKQQPATASNPFGASPTPENAFGPSAASSSQQPSASGAPASNPFGGSSQSTNPNPFGAPSSTSNPFAASSNVSSQPFGALSTQPAAVVSTFREVNGNSSSSYVQPTGGDLSTYSSRDQSGRLVAFKGKRVQYKDNEPGYLGQDGAWNRIFFPDGPPSHTSQTTTDPNDQYDGATEAAYKQLQETGSFPEGSIPLLPPKKEWVRWDF